MELIKKENMIEAFQNCSVLVLPILDKETLNLFFEEDDMLFSKIDKIKSLSFVYVGQNDGFCPSVNCKVNYEFEDAIPNQKYFVYDEFDDAICLGIFLIRLEKYANYINGWVEREYKKKIEVGEKGMEIIDLFNYINTISSMGGFMLQPRDTLLKLIGEKFVIADKKFT